MEAEKPTRYFVAKCPTMSHLSTARSTSVWACMDRVGQSQHPRQFLADAFKDGAVVLVFSVNGSSGWQGYASMTSPPSDDDAVDKPVTVTTDPKSSVEYTNHDYQQPCDDLPLPPSFDPDITSVQTSHSPQNDSKGDSAVEGAVQPSRAKVWHRFAIGWHEVCAGEAERCLGFHRTEHLRCHDGRTPANRARNLQVQ